MNTDRPEIRLLDVVQALMWNDGTDAVIGWSSDYDAVLQSCFRNKVAASPEAIPLAEALDLLSPARRRAVLRRPFVAFNLLSKSWDEQAIRLIAAHLAHELREIGIISPADGVTHREFGTSVKCGSDCGSELAFVLVNEVGPLAAPSFGGLDRAALERLDNAAEAAVQKKLIDAWNIIANVSGGVARFVDTFTEVIVIQRHPPTEAEFNSSSFSGLAGLTVLTNPHASVVDVATMADALVHEAIHGALYAYEAIAGELLLPHMQANIRIESPWTGALLNLESFCQACVVWYGLSWFWQRAQDARLMVPRASALGGKARQGFTRGAVTMILDSHGEFVSQPARRMLEAIAWRMAA